MASQKGIPKKKIQQDMTSLKGKPMTNTQHKMAAQKGMAKKSPVRPDQRISNQKNSGSTVSSGIRPIPKAADEAPSSKTSIISERSGTFLEVDSLSVDEPVKSSPGKERQNAPDTDITDTHSAVSEAFKDAPPTISLITNSMKYGKRWSIIAKSKRNRKPNSSSSIPQTVPEGELLIPSVSVKKTEPKNGEDISVTDISKAQAVDYGSKDNGSARSNVTFLESTTSRQYDTPINRSRNPTKDDQAKSTRDKTPQSSDAMSAKRTERKKGFGFVGKVPALNEVKAKTSLDDVKDISSEINQQSILGGVKKNVPLVLVGEQQLSSENVIKHANAETGSGKSLSSLSKMSQPIDDKSSKKSSVNVSRTRAEQSDQLLTDKSAETSQWKSLTAQEVPGFDDPDELETAIVRRYQSEVLQDFPDPNQLQNIPEDKIVPRPAYYTDYQVKPPKDTGSMQKSEKDQQEFYMIPKCTCDNGIDTAKYEYGRDCESFYNYRTRFECRPSKFSNFRECNSRVNYKRTVDCGSERMPSHTNKTRANDKEVPDIKQKKSMKKTKENVEDHRSEESELQNDIQKSSSDSDERPGTGTKSRHGLKDKVKKGRKRKVRSKERGAQTAEEHTRGDGKRRKKHCNVIRTVIESTRDAIECIGNYLRPFDLTAPPELTDGAGDELHKSRSQLGYSNGHPRTQSASPYAGWLGTHSYRAGADPLCDSEYELVPLPLYQYCQGCWYQRGPVVFGDVACDCMNPASYRQLNDRPDYQMPCGCKDRDPELEEEVHIFIKERRTWRSRIYAARGSPARQMFLSHVGTNFNVERELMDETASKHQDESPCTVLGQRKSYTSHTANSLRANCSDPRDHCKEDIEDMETNTTRQHIIKMCNLVSQQKSRVCFSEPENTTGNAHQFQENERREENPHTSLQIPKHDQDRHIENGEEQSQQEPIIQPSRIEDIQHVSFSRKETMDDQSEQKPDAIGSLRRHMSECSTQKVTATRNVLNVEVKNSFPPGSLQKAYSSSNDTVDSSKKESSATLGVLNIKNTVPSSPKFLEKTEKSSSVKPPFKIQNLNATLSGSDTKKCELYPRIPLKNAGKSSKITTSASHTKSRFTLELTSPRETNSLQPLSINKTGNKTRKNADKFDRKAGYTSNADFTQNHSQSLTGQSRYVSSSEEESPQIVEDTDTIKPPICLISSPYYDTRTTLTRSCSRSFILSQSCMESSLIAQDALQNERDQTLNAQSGAKPGAKSGPKGKGPPPKPPAKMKPATGPPSKKPGPPSGSPSRRRKSKEIPDEKKDLVKHEEDQTGPDKIDLKVHSAKHESNPDQTESENDGDSEAQEMVSVDEESGIPAAPRHIETIDSNRRSDVKSPTEIHNRAQSLHKESPKREEADEKSGFRHAERASMKKTSEKNGSPKDNRTSLKPGQVVGDNDGSRRSQQVSSYDDCNRLSRRSSTSSATFHTGVSPEEVEKRLSQLASEAGKDEDSKNQRTQDGRDRSDRKGEKMMKAKKTRKQEIQESIIKEAKRRKQDQRRVSEMPQSECDNPDPYTSRRDGSIIAHEGYRNGGRLPSERERVYNRRESNHHECPVAAFPRSKSRSFENDFQQHRTKERGTNEPHGRKSAERDPCKFIQRSVSPQRSSSPSDSPCGFRKRGQYGQTPRLLERKEARPASGPCTRPCVSVSCAVRSELTSSPNFGHYAKDYTGRRTPRGFASPVSGRFTRCPPYSPPYCRSPHQERSKHFKPIVADQGDRRGPKGRASMYVSDTDTSGRLDHLCCDQNGFVGGKGWSKPANRSTHGGRGLGEGRTVNRRKEIVKNTSMDSFNTRHSRSPPQDTDSQLPRRPSGQLGDKRLEKDGGFTADEETSPSTHNDNPCMTTSGTEDSRFHSARRQLQRQMSFERAKTHRPPQPCPDEYRSRGRPNEQRTCRTGDYTGVASRSRSNVRAQSSSSGNWRSRGRAYGGDSGGEYAAFRTRCGSESRVGAKKAAQPDYSRVGSERFVSPHRRRFYECPAQALPHSTVEPARHGDIQTEAGRKQSSESRRPSVWGRTSRGKTGLTGPHADQRRSSEYSPGQIRVSGYHRVMRPPPLGRRGASSVPPRSRQAGGRLERQEAGYSSDFDTDNAVYLDNCCMDNIGYVGFPEGARGPYYGGQNRAPDGGGWGAGKGQYDKKLDPPGVVIFQLAARFATFGGIRVSGGVRVLMDAPEKMGYVQIISPLGQPFITHYVNTLNFLHSSSAAGVAWSAVVWEPPGSRGSNTDMNNGALDKEDIPGRVDSAQVIFCEPYQAHRFRAVLETVRAAFCGGDGAVVTPNVPPFNPCCPPNPCPNPFVIPCGSNTGPCSVPANPCCPTPAFDPCCPNPCPPAPFSTPQPLPYPPPRTDGCPTVCAPSCPPPVCPTPFCSNMACPPCPAPNPCCPTPNPCCGGTSCNTNPCQGDEDPYAYTNAYGKTLFCQRACMVKLGRDEVWQEMHRGCLMVIQEPCCMGYSLVMVNEQQVVVAIQKLSRKTEFKPSLTTQYGFYYNAVTTTEKGSLHENFLVSFQCKSHEEQFKCVTANCRRIMQMTSSQDHSNSNMGPAGAQGETVGCGAGGALKQCLGPTSGKIGRPMKDQGGEGCTPLPGDGGGGISGMPGTARGGCGGGFGEAGGAIGGDCQTLDGREQESRNRSNFYPKSERSYLQFNNHNAINFSENSSAAVSGYFREFGPLFSGNAANTSSYTDTCSQSSVSPEYR